MRPPHLERHRTERIGWLRAAVAAMRRWPQAVAVSGRTTYPGRSTLEKALGQELCRSGYLSVSGGGPHAHQGPIQVQSQDHDGDTVYLTRLQWDIDRIERDHPEITLSATKEMMV